MFLRMRKKAFFADTQKFFPATAIYNAFCTTYYLLFTPVVEKRATEKKENTIVTKISLTKTQYNT